MLIFQSFTHCSWFCLPLCFGNLINSFHRVPSSPGLLRRIAHDISGYQYCINSVTAPDPRLVQSATRGGLVRASGASHAAYSTLYKTCPYLHSVLRYLFYSNYTTIHRVKIIILLYAVYSKIYSTWSSEGIKVHWIHFIYNMTCVLWCLMFCVVIWIS